MLLYMRKFICPVFILRLSKALILRPGAMKHLPWLRVCVKISCSEIRIIRHWCPTFPLRRHCYPALFRLMQTGPKCIQVTQRAITTKSIPAVEVQIFNKYLFISARDVSFVSRCHAYSHLLSWCTWQIILTLSAPKRPYFAASKLRKSAPIQDYLACFLVLSISY